MTYVSDPAGLLVRAPELEHFVSDPGVRRAIEAGAPHQVYRALWWASLRGRFRENRTQLNALLSHRRLFIKPLNGRAPAMFTYNGIGTRIYGQSELDAADATYITTLFFTFVFIPIIPLGQYLVRDEGGNRYTFFGKVPLSGMVRTWHGLVGAGAALALLAGAAAAYEGSKSHVHFVNALDMPVSIKVEDEEFVLEAGQRTDRRLGATAVDVLDPSRKRIEGGNVSGESGTFVWNVLGAGLIYQEDVEYRLYAPPAELSGPEPKVGCGEANPIDYSDAEYVLVDPPTTVSIPKGQSSHVVQHVGWEQTIPKLGCAFYYASTGNDQKTMLEIQRLGDAVGYSPDLVAILSRSAAPPSNRPEAYAALQRAARVPNAPIETHRAYQEAAFFAGEREQVTVEYARLAEGQPQNADLRYLALRLAPEGPSVLAQWQELKRLHPNHVYIRRALAYQYQLEGRFSEALAELDGLNADATQGVDEIRRMRMEYLVGAEKFDDALALIKETMVAAPDPSERSAWAAFYAMTAFNLNRDYSDLFDLQHGNAETITPELVFLMSKSDRTQSVERGQLDDKRRGTVELYEACESPESIVSYVDDSGHLDVLFESPMGWLVAYAEALRRNDPARIGALESRSPYPIFMTAQISAFFKDGTKNDWVDGIPTMLLLRARAPSVSAEERAALLLRARRLAPIPTLFDSLVMKWHA